MDRHLAELMRAVVGSDPDGELDDNKRQAVMFALLGMISPEQLEALWRFSESISDPSIRSSLLKKVVAFQIGQENRWFDSGTLLAL